MQFLNYLITFLNIYFLNFTGNMILSRKTVK